MIGFVTEFFRFALGYYQWYSTLAICGLGFLGALWCVDRIYSRMLWEEEDLDD